MSLVPLNFFVQHDGRSARQHVTCRYKCGDACSRPVPNDSTNEYFGDVVQRVSRRTLLRTTGVTVLAVGAGTALAACSTDAPPTSSPEPEPVTPSAGMNFASVAPNSEDAVVIPDGYRQAVVISWGDPVVPGAPAFDVTKQTAAAQRGQFGFNNDFAGLLPIPGSADRFLLVTNHEYTTEQFMHPGYDAERPLPTPPDAPSWAPSPTVRAA
ncbi:hypothetical protein JCM12141A_16370 [Mycolicibacterium hodleri]